TDGVRPTVKQRFAGPAKAGDEVVVSLTMSGARPVVVGRLVDGAGAPVADMDVIGEIVAQGDDRKGFGGAEAKTDTAGRFRFTFARPPGPTDGAKLDLARKVMHSDTSWTTRSVAVVALPAQLAPGDNDVGAITVAG